MSYCLKTRHELRDMVEQHAAEEAKRDLNFSGALNLLPPHQQKKFRAVIILYAKNGAARAFDLLDLHQRINMEKRP